MAQHRYEIVEVDVAPRLVAGVRARVPRGGVAQAFGACLDEVYTAGRQWELQLDGQNVFIYRDGDADTLLVDFCVGARAPFRPVGSVEPMFTPGGRAVMTTHHGEYGGLHAANVAIRKWMKEKGLDPAGPSWEVYGHWDPDPAKLRTDVYWLVEE